MVEPGKYFTKLRTNVLVISIVLLLMASGAIYRDYEQALTAIVIGLIAVMKELVSDS